ncbi:MAG: TRAP transporter small permease [Geminicoccaceae bacterium]|nr:TRAP transporter small permease [Geminicoccaceae bacterium]
MAAGVRETVADAIPNFGDNGMITRTMTALRTLDRALLLLNANLVVVALLSMAVVVITLVVGRNMFGLSFFWGEELARYAMIYMAFLGGAMALRSDQNPRLTVFIDKLPGGVRKYLERLIAVFMAATLVILFLQGIDITLNEGRMTTPALRIKYFWVYLAVPIGAGAMLIQLLFSQFLASPLTIREDEDIVEVIE